MRHVWRSETMKYTTLIDAYAEENTDAALTDCAIRLIQAREPDFVYLYMVETDDKGGHDHGWMTPEYLKQLANAVGCVQKVFEAAKERYHILVTADHGGHDRTHGTDSPEDMTIPMFFWGKGFEGGRQLQNLTLLDITPTIADLMGLPMVREWEGKSVLR